MTTSHPAWWQKAEPELHAAVEGFTDKLRQRLQIPPERFVDRKNPFLFRIRAGTSAVELASRIIDAYLSSSEETIFGNVLEEFAITICKHARKGQKSSTEGIDLEYTDSSKRRTLVQIKSGENWGNSSQRKKLEEDFKRARRVLGQSSSTLQVRCIEGICYGRSKTENLGSHERLVGHDFWREISGWNGTGAAILEMLGHHAGNGLQNLREEARDQIIDYFKENEVVRGDTVLWDELLDLVMRPPQKGKRAKS